MRIPNNVDSVVPTDLYSIEEAISILKCCRTTLRRYTKGMLIESSVGLDGRTYYKGSSIINFCHGKMPSGPRARRERSA